MIDKHYRECYALCIKEQEGQRMTDIRKIKRTALVVFCVVSVSLLLHLAHIAYSIWLMAGSVNMVDWNTPAVIASFLATPILLASLVISLILLHTIRKEDTPFTLRNVKRLKVIALMLILLEPVSFLAERIFFHFMSWGDGMIVVTTTQAGFILSVGLITYCIALVFQYGIALQDQVDETL